MWTSLFSRSSQKPAHQITHSDREDPTRQELLKELSLEEQMEALDQYLRVQNMRRLEEERLRRVFAESRLWNGIVFGFLTFALLPSEAHAADLEGTLRNLVTAFTGRILPILALGYLGKNIFSHIAGDPNARNETARVVIAVACLLGLSGVWSFISQQTR